MSSNLEIGEGEALKKWLAHNQKSVSDLARELGMSRQNLYLYLSQKEVSEDFKNRLAARGYDVFGTGLVKNSTDSETKTQLNRNLKLTSPQTLTNNYGIPMLPTDETAFDPEAKTPVPVYQLTDPEMAGAEFGLILRGASMYPKYMPGSRIALRKTDKEEIIYSLVYYVITQGGTRTVVYIEPDPAGRDEWVLLRPHNPDMHPTPMLRDRLAHVYQVLGSVQYE